MSLPRAKCSVYIATSLDGFISRSDGSIDWLTEASGLVPTGEDCGHAAYMSTVDAIVMGRNTFDQVLTFGKWPYGATPVIVMSRRETPLPDDVPDTVTLSRESPQDLVESASRRGVKHLYIDGGVTIQGFLDQGLIDELTITVIPILLGAGRPLFGPLPNDVKTVTHRNARVRFRIRPARLRHQSRMTRAPTLNRRRTLAPVLFPSPGPDTGERL